MRGIEAHARESYPEECCGFLLGHADTSRIVSDSRRAKNIAPEHRERRYVIDPLELLRADDAARAAEFEVIGIYHSHPDHPAAPSEFDRTRAASWYSYVIVSIIDREPRELTAWRYDDATKAFKTEKLVQR